MIIGVIEAKKFPTIRMDGFNKNTPLALNNIPDCIDITAATPKKATMKIVKT